MKSDTVYAVEDKPTTKRTYRHVIYFYPKDSMKIPCSIKSIFKNCSKSTIRGNKLDGEPVNERLGEEGSDETAINIAEESYRYGMVDIVVVPESRYGDARNFETIKELWKKLRDTRDDKTVRMICVVPDGTKDEIRKKYVNHRFIGADVVRECDAERLKIDLEWFL